jgi:predicted small lipoprotein YifL
MKTRVIVALLLGALVAGCGKKGPPTPPGPAEQVTYPKVYPTK